MKRFFILFVVMSFFTVTISTTNYRRLRKDALSESVSAKVEGVTLGAAAVTGDPMETVEVFSHITKKTQTMSMRDYIVGVVAAEMPAEYETEALKAQALAAISYARYQNLKNIAVSTDSNVSQGFRTKEEMQADWGDRFDENYEKIENAVKAVEGLSLEYDGQPILAAYFAVSSGRTENAADIWGTEYPYLVSVSSDGDMLSPGYENKVCLTASELVEKIRTIQPVTPPDDPMQYIGEIDRSDAGSVLSVNLCGVEFSGEQVRSALGLTSAVFTAEYTEESFVFTVKGYGHGVGMSQYGADYMARQGADFAQILLHYYTGAQIVQTII